MVETLAFCLTADSHPHEWEQMWAALAMLPGNSGDPCCFDPVTGQMWQYLCTSHTEDGWFHYFRHRHHPSTGERESVLIPVCLADCLPDHPASAQPEPQ